MSLQHSQQEGDQGCDHNVVASLPWVVCQLGLVACVPGVASLCVQEVASPLEACVQEVASPTVACVQEVASPPEAYALVVASRMGDA